MKRISKLRPTRIRRLREELAAMWTVLQTIEIATETKRLYISFRRCHFHYILSCRCPVPYRTCVPLVCRISHWFCNVALGGMELRRKNPNPTPERLLLQPSPFLIAITPCIYYHKHLGATTAMLPLGTPTFQPHTQQLQNHKIKCVLYLKEKSITLESFFLSKPIDFETTYWF